MDERDGELKIIRGARVVSRAAEAAGAGGKARAGGVVGRTVGGAPTAAQLEALQEEAKREGYEQGRLEGQAFGHREGLEEGRRAVQEKVQRLDGLMRALDMPFRELDDQVEREIVTLVIGMVRQLVRREIRTDPAQIVGVVREALAVLPVSSRAVRVLLHPEDAELVREAYAIGDADLKWQMVEDPVIQRGGCKVVTETSRVDATLESRINALIAPLLAGQREADGGDE
jgi:flagellar assembly protein FliH